MILENPAPALNIGVQDILGILEGTLRDKNWRNFEMASLKLIYVPHYLFNYDVLVEQEGSSQGFSGNMAMNAITGKLESLLSDVVEKQMISFEKELSHDLQYELEQPAVRENEVADACKVKLAGQFGVTKSAISVSGFRLVNWPVWRIFVQLPRRPMQKIDIEAVSGYALNFSEVPVKEKTWLEVTSDTLTKMKTPGGWAELSKKAASTAASGARAAATKEPGETKAGGATYWLLHTKMGRYTILLVLLLIFLFIVMSSGQQGGGVPTPTAP
jgi:hypothetical protein